MEWLAAFFQILNVTPTDSKLMLAKVQRRTMMTPGPLPIPCQREEREGELRCCPHGCPRPLLGRCPRPVVDFQLQVVISHCVMTKID